MAKKEKIKEVIERQMIVGNKKGTFMAQLIRVNANRYRVDVLKQSTKEVERETEEMITSTVKRLVIQPDTEGLKNEEIKTRVSKVDKYMKDKSTAEALEPVADEIIKAKNKDEKDTVLNWIPQIEKDLGFKIQKMYDSTPTTEKVINIVTDTEFVYKDHESFDFYFRLRSRDFKSMVNNFLNQ